MTPTDVLRHFRESGALLEGHFKLSSGLHSNKYLQCALVLQHPARAEALGAAIGEATRAWGANVVLSPAMGGLALSSEDRALIVEDVLTTGKSTRETIDVAVAAGATVVGAASIMDRSGGKHGLDVPFAGLCPMDVPAYTEAECPLCQQGLPVTKPGSRR
jgi:orotate phosphoribosyltransferase